MPQPHQRFVPRRDVEINSRRDLVKGALWTLVKMFSPQELFFGDARAVRIEFLLL